MKTLILLVSIIFQCISCELIFAQQENLISKDSNKPLKMGFGVDLLDFNIYGGGMRCCFILPVDIYQFRIEPEVYFDREKAKDRLIKQYSVGLSCYRLVDLKIINLLPGGTVIYRNYKQEFGQLDEDNKSITFGPIIGAEYFFIDNFSIGINLGLVFEFLKTDEWSDETRNYKNITTESGLRIRFYFL